MAFIASLGRRRLTVRSQGTRLRWILQTVAAGGLIALLCLGANLAFWRVEVSADEIALAASPIAPRGGSLVICGGGKIPESVRGRFIELAGGPSAKIVLIPTAGVYTGVPSDERILEPWKNRGLASLDLFHTFSREQANDPEFVKILGEATGVWFGGGRQSLLMDAYRGTEVEKQLRALLTRGGVIGGTSAGAAVMSRVMITSGREEARLAEGFDFLSEAIIDQHFLKRNRVKRLVNVVKKNPNFVGLGVDEQTALVVDILQKRFRVIGESYVVACLPEVSKIEGEPTTTRLEILKPGDEADITALRELKSGAVIPGLDLTGF